VVHFDVSNVVRALDEMKIGFEFIEFVFNEPAGTSRGVMHSKPSWFIEVFANGLTGRGEISVIPGLSVDYHDNLSFEKKIANVISVFELIPIEDWVENPQEFLFNSLIEHELYGFPSIRMGFEMAYFSWLNQNGNFFILPIHFENLKIPINGLVWMGDIPTMRARIKQKLDDGYTTMKMKIGSLDWQQEKLLLKELRDQFSSNELTIRVDANGALTEKNAEEVLRDLSALQIHSIEQPLKKGLLKQTAKLNNLKLIDIAIDEELIGIESEMEMLELLQEVKVSYIVLKPSLHGGFKGVKKWISCADQLGVGWWITSALESSIGLQAIAEFTALYPISIPHGLGTGSIYKNNLPSRLVVQNGYLTTIK